MRLHWPLLELYLIQEASPALVYVMPQYFFRIRNGRYSGTSNTGIEAPDSISAWTEMTRVCGELVGGIARRLKSNSEWEMEMLDEAQKPLFRIRLVAETMTDPAAEPEDRLALPE